MSTGIANLFWTKNKQKVKELLDIGKIVC